MSTGDCSWVTNMDPKDVQLVHTLIETFQKHVLWVISYPGGKYDYQCVPKQRSSWDVEPIPIQCITQEHWVDILQCMDYSSEFTQASMAKLAQKRPSYIALRRFPESSLVIGDNQQDVKPLPREHLWALPESDQLEYILKVYKANTLDLLLADLNSKCVVTCEQWGCGCDDGCDHCHEYTRSEPGIIDVSPHELEDMGYEVPWHGKSDLPRVMRVNDYETRFIKLDTVEQLRLVYVSTSDFLDLDDDEDEDVEDHE